MAGPGGARPGAGRKRSDVRKVLDSAAQKADKLIAAHLPTAIRNMIVLADGVTVQEANPLTGETTIYTRPPDRAANEYLINRAMGKPTEKSQSDVNLKGGVEIYLPQRRPPTQGEE